MPVQLCGSTSIVKLSLQSSIIPDGQSRPIELGVLILKPFALFLKLSRLFGKSLRQLSVSFKDDGDCVLDVGKEIGFFSQQKRTSKFSHCVVFDNC